MTEEIYFDNAASARPFDEVSELVRETMVRDYGNPSSLHRRGVRGMSLVRESQKRVARLVGGANWRVIFTSGGTEANTMAVLGCAPKGRRKNVVTSSLEHSSVEESCQEVEARGGGKVVVKAKGAGVLDPKDFQEAVDDGTALVSVVHVAGEMCTVQPIEMIAKKVKRENPRVLVHVDAVQAAGGLGTLDYPDEVDMVTVSGHKIHGPSGVGALLLRPGVSPRALLRGGDQQDGLRPGTLNLPGIVGMGLAATMTLELRGDAVKRMRANVNLFIDGIKGDGVRLLCDAEARAPGLAVLAVTGVKSEILLHVMEKYRLYASSGSACHSTRTAPPSCLVDAGLKGSEGVVRFSLGYDTTKAQVEAASSIFKRAVEETRAGKAG